MQTRLETGIPLSGTELRDKLTTLFTKAWSAGTQPELSFFITRTWSYRDHCRMPQEDFTWKLYDYSQETTLELDKTLTIKDITNLLEEFKHNFNLDFLTDYELSSANTFNPPFFRIRLTSKELTSELIESHIDALEESIMYNPYDDQWVCAIYKASSAGKLLFQQKLIDRGFTAIACESQSSDKDTSSYSISLSENPHLKAIIHERMDIRENSQIKSCFEKILKSPWFDTWSFTPSYGRSELLSGEGRDRVINALNKIGLEITIIDKGATCCPSADWSNHYHDSSIHQSPHFHMTINPTSRAGAQVTQLLKKIKDDRAQMIFNDLIHFSLPELQRFKHKIIRADQIDKQELLDPSLPEIAVILKPLCDEYGLELLYIDGSDNKPVTASCFRIQIIDEEKFQNLIGYIDAISTDQPLFIEVDSDGQLMEILHDLMETHHTEQQELILNRINFNQHLKSLRCKLDYFSLQHLNDERMATENLIMALDTAKIEFLKSHDESAINVFIAQCKTAINLARPALEHHHGMMMVLTEILNALTFALSLSLSYVDTGKYRFHHITTDAEDILNAMELQTDGLKPTSK